MPKFYAANLSQLVWERRDAMVNISLARTHDLHRLYPSRDKSILNAHFPHGRPRNPVLGMGDHRSNGISKCVLVRSLQMVDEG